MKIVLKILTTVGILSLLSIIIIFIFLSEPSQQVHIVSPSTQIIKDDVEFSARIKSEHQYTLYSPVEGIVTNLPHGNIVAKAQLLAKIKQEQDQFADSQTEARLYNSISQYELAIQQNNEEFNRINNAVNAGVIPRYKLDEVRSKLQRANANQAAARKELISYQKDKQKRKAIRQKQINVKSLSNGIITKKLVFEGQWVKRGEALLRIISTDNLTIKAMIPPNQASKLRLGQNVIVSKQDPDFTWNETVLGVSPVISQEFNTKNLQEITISLVNAIHLKKSINETVKITINNPDSSPAMSLPIEAVSREGKKFYVLYIDKSKKASLSETYASKGFINALRQLKCEFKNCNMGVYGLSKKQILVGNSNLNRVQVDQSLSPKLKIVIPDSGMDEYSFVTVENNG